MEKRDRGFALLLMGIILAMAGHVFWCIGVVMGMIGVILVFCSRKEK